MSNNIVGKNEKTEITKGHLRWAALFLGELRDGLTMVRFVVATLYHYHAIRMLPNHSLRFSPNSSRFTKQHDVRISIHRSTCKVPF